MNKKFNAFIEKLTVSRNKREKTVETVEDSDSQYQNVLDGPLYYRISQPFGYHIPDVNTVVDDFEVVYDKLKTGFNKVRDRNLELIKENISLKKKLEQHQLMLSMMEISEENINIDTSIQDFSDSLLHDSQIRDEEDALLGNQELIHMLNRDTVLEVSRKLQFSDVSKASKINKIEEVQKKIQNGQETKAQETKSEVSKEEEPNNPNKIENWIRSSATPGLIEDKVDEPVVIKPIEDQKIHQSVSRKQPGASEQKADKPVKKRSIPGLDDIIE